MEPIKRSPDLAAQSFLVLRSAFFGDQLAPSAFDLRDKLNTQDDPLDEYVHRLLDSQLPDDVYCARATGPLISPDLILFRPALCDGVERAVLASDPSRIVGLEVKKVQRTPAGPVARASGMDYNTTPPCGMIRAYAKDNRPLDVRGFYLFVCLGPDANRTGGYRLSGLALCDGNLLNEDFSYYLSIVGERTKRVGLGTYGDGADRSRPMVIFANPLGTAELGCTVTLVHSRTDLDTEFTEIRQVGRIGRTDTLGRIHTFTCYRHRKDVADSQIIFDLLDPFPAPIRTERTQSRGRFKINVAPGD